jgi:hypothetical protein
MAAANAFLSEPHQASFASLLLSLQTRCVPRFQRVSRY